MKFVKECQVCGSSNLDQVLSLGYMPPVNQMIKIGDRGKQDWLPTDLLHCRDCQLVQLSIVADKEMVFPADYPYTSGTTKLLRDNFHDLQAECEQVLLIEENDLVVDIGSNDGTLLSYFQSAGHLVVGIEPTDIADIANDRGVSTVKGFLGRETVSQVLLNYGQAKLVTMANCFAHVENVHSVIDNVKRLLKPGGVFVTESHYLHNLVSGLQFDTIYHEHLRYYSLGVLQRLFTMHDMEIFHARRIPTHGGSIRVYACAAGQRDHSMAVHQLLSSESKDWRPRLDRFAQDVRLLKYKVLNELSHKKMAGHRIVGISAPSRAATLVNYFGLDEDIIDYVCEIKGSLKVGRYMPGTQIPIVDEEILQREQPESLLILSWHIAEELVPKLRGKGYAGNVLIPLPTMRAAA